MGFLSPQSGGQSNRLTALQTPVHSPPSLGFDSLAKLQIHPARGRLPEVLEIPHQQLGKA